jgi:protein-L-isoaspartate(D-aspartate) O-methyltransferase
VPGPLEENGPSMCRQQRRQEPDDPLREAAKRLRAQLVDNLIAVGAVHDTAVKQAMMKVPRHLFLPGVPLEQAYADTAVPTHWENQVAVSSASQPTIVAIMLQQLRSTLGARVLEIGAGTGYNAALLSELAGPTGSVTSLEFDPVIAAEAFDHLLTAGYSDVKVIAADGAAGWQDGAPYDRIILTVGASDIAPAWFSQLRDDGVLVLPLWLGGLEVSVAFRKRGSALVSESQIPCGFMRLRGEEAGSEEWVSLPNGRKLFAEHAAELAEPIAKLLSTRPRLRLWLRPQLPFFQHLGLGGHRLIALYPDRPPKPGHRLVGRRGIYVEDEDGPSLALFAVSSPLLLAFGSGTAEHVMMEEYARWQQLDVQPIEQWHITAHPRELADPEQDTLSADAVRVLRPHFVFTIDVARAGRSVLDPGSSNVL